MATDGAAAAESATGFGANAATLGVNERPGEIRFNVTGNGAPPRGDAVSEPACPPGTAPASA